jgi:Xaa-Pro dipeptidase
LTSKLISNDKLQPQVLLLAGESLGYRHDTDRELLFRQESNFFYLTGCNVPSAFLLASYHPQSDFPVDSKAYETTKATLLVPQAELSDMMWSIPPPSISEASQSHDVTQVAYVSTLAEALENIVKTMPGATVHTLPQESLLFPKLPTTYGGFLSDSGVVKVTDAYLLNAVQQTRLIKDSEEIALIKQANEVSSRAHEVVMRVLGKAVKGKIANGAPDRPLLPGEWLIEKEAEAEAVFVASCRREGYVFFAIPLSS